MKIGIIVDNMAVARWQADALRELKRDDECIVYNCTNTRPAPRRFKNLLYYALNLFTVRNAYTRMVPLPTDLPVANIIDFRTEDDGGWQRLPATLLDEIAAQSPALILKFGLGLLRIPGQSQLAVPILSYHHGDPEHFRGRPAGFHEMRQGRRTMGQVVQILSNTLDAGAPVAYGETRILAHSYKASLKEAYRHSPLLLNQAIGNAVGGTSLSKKTTGRNYRLPTNFMVVRLCLKIGWEKVKRLFYGAFIEKGWQVAEAPADPDLVLQPVITFPAVNVWKSVATPKGYAFLADPFFHPGGDGLLVEALSQSTQRGQILHIGAKRTVSLSDPACHHSYPAGLSIDGVSYLIPEVANWSPARIFRLQADGLEGLGALKLPGAPCLLDPTLCQYDDTLFLFANIKGEGSSVLRLWHGVSLFDEFVEHPCSPVRVSPAGSRMGGAIVEIGSSLIRIGQDFRGQYGDGLIFFRIDVLNRKEYRETEWGEFRLAGRSGPHTLNFRDGRIAFDWYRPRFSPFAGLRRFRQMRNPLPAPPRQAHSSTRG